ncbi:metallophosphoesterase family protein [Algivirga pacifica]|uniref:Metallophosphoesterase family protein n=1 Tax=Algivirga pacifica TaxID=1162670 RepID=A0ABP9D2G1_9BACT
MVWNRWTTSRQSHKNGQYVIKADKGRRWVIGDIHGYAATFKTLLKKIKLQEEDQLFLLGDYINKGPDSKEVLDTIIRLRKQGYQVYALKGNHEEELIQALLKTEGKIPTRYRHLRLENKEGMIKQKYWKMLTDMPYYIETEGFYMVHAGFNLDEGNPLVDLGAMLKIRNHGDIRYWGISKRRKVLVGHTPVPLNEIHHRIHERSPIIILDNGVASHRNGYGRLLALDIDRWKLQCQEHKG